MRMTLKPLKVSDSVSDTYLIPILLILSLAVPNPALALRALSAGEKGSPANIGLEEALHPAAPAGLEENGKIPFRHLGLSQGGRRILGKHKVYNISRLKLHPLEEVLAWGVPLADVKRLYWSSQRAFAGVSWHTKPRYPKLYPDSIISLGLPNVTVSILRDNGIFAIQELLLTSREKIQKFHPRSFFSGSSRPKRIGVEGLQRIEKALAQRGEKLRSRSELALLRSSAAVTSTTDQPPTRRKRREIGKRILAEFLKVTPAPQVVVGIGPTEARQHKEVLGFLRVLMPASLRQRIFVVAADATQGQELAASDFIASSEPILVVGALVKRFKEAGPIQLVYDATDPEKEVLEGELRLFKAGDQFSLIQQDTVAQLQVFLQGILANLMQIEPEQVKDRVNLDQLAKDLTLLIKS